MSFNRMTMQYYKLGQALAKQAATQKAGLRTSAVRRGVSQGEVHPGYKKLRVKMEQFQVDDGTPVHLKGGTVDLILYYITLGACGLGLIGCFDYYYHAAFPKKPAA